MRRSAPQKLSYRRLFEAAQDGILILDVDTGRITDVNSFLIKLLGFTHSEMVGKNRRRTQPIQGYRVESSDCWNDYKKMGMSAMKTCR